MSKMSEYTQKENRGTILRLIKYFGKTPKKTALALILALILNVATIMQPLVIRAVIDDFLAPGIFDINAIIALSALYFFVALVANGVGYAQMQVLRSLGQEILHKIRTELFGHIQNMNMRFFDNNASGRILTRVTSDVESLSELYSNVFIMVIRESLLVTGMLVTMFLLDPQLALWSLISVPIVLALTILYRIFARRNFIKMKTLLSKINGYLAENIIGMKIIQIFNREKVKFKAFDEMNEEYYRLGMVEVLLNGMSNPFITMISNLMAAILIAVFYGSVTGGQLDIGILFIFTTYVRQLYAPVAQLADQLTIAQSALISADRIFDIMDNTEDIEDLKIGEKLDGVMGHIEFKNVWFAYNSNNSDDPESNPKENVEKSENWVLKDVSFRVSPGQHAAFIGATGCGKTTIMSLISRFYEIQKGEILI
ncbi:MAG: ABC transporter transmembrane domain-containing protein, partial [Defluviitaleaceae bacterium]|nr:ABC transporter transmembrane domain-containing protein [Defluviitaleaceae bacterium]